MLLNQSTHQSVKNIRSFIFHQRINQSTKKVINQSSNQCINESINLINQKKLQPVNQSTNQPSNHPIKQISQPHNQPRRAVIKQSTYLTTNRAKPTDKRTNQTSPSIKHPNAKTLHPSTADRYELEELTLNHNSQVQHQLAKGKTGPG